MTKEIIGFVGVGLMGHGMAKNLLAGGYEVHVFGHRNRTPVDNLVSLGAQEALSLEALGSVCSIIHICAPGSPQVESIVVGLSSGLKSGSVIIDCSTSDPNSTLALSQKLSASGVAFADAPLGGTPTQAESGQLSAMVGCDDSLFERLQPVIETWAATIVHIGDVGDGHRMKLLNNFLSMGYAAMYSEALALGNKIGLPPEKFDSVIRGSRMDCGFYQTFMDYILNGNREAHKFTLTNAYKDMRYLEAVAASAGIANPIGNAVKNSFAVALAAGNDGPEDYVPKLAEIMGKINGTDLTQKS